MEPFFFDSAGDKLFGVYHPAQDVFSQKAVLICPPIYAEYFRTYRYFRNLADSWSMAGYHVLRFDYFGTGDSAGEWRDAGPNRWLEDLGAAATELREISGCGSVTLAGARFGATLALLAAANSGLSSRVLVWDPVVNGREYVDSLERTHARLLNKSYANSDSVLSASMAELAGFSREPWLDAELSQIDVRSMNAGDVSSVEYVVSNHSYLDKDLIRNLSAQSVEIHERLREDDCDWETPSEVAMQAFGIFEELKLCL